MRFNCFAVLAVTSLLACAGSASTSSVTKTIEHDFPAAILSDANYNNGALGAKRVLRAHEIPDKENEDRMFNWAKSNAWSFKDKSTSNVLGKIKFDPKVGEGLDSSRLKTLAENVDMFNKKHPKHKVSLFETLRTSYKEDDLAKALVTAKQTESTREIATRLEQQQFAFWLEKRISPDDVFFMLRINGDAQHAMHSRKLETLEQYIPIFNEGYKDSRTDMLTVLRNGFGDADLARALAMAKQEHSSATMLKNGEKYQKELFSKWMAMGKDNEPFDTNRVMTEVFKLNSFTESSPADKLALNHYSVFYKKNARTKSS
uniref:RxLR effector protein n=1 Tax=Phytophthora sojae TaxID=67593 RepID=G1FRS5_PHYSO|nr:Avh168 [Phytophthora sojae]